MKTHPVLWEDFRMSGVFRKVTLDLLNKNEDALHEIERAASVYRAFIPAAVEAKETPTQVSADLNRLINALATLNEFFRYDNRGSARHLFVGEAADQGVLRQAMQLEAALDRGDGDRLGQAAQTALDKWSASMGDDKSRTKRGRKKGDKSPATNGIRELVDAIAVAAKKLDIEPKRSGVFPVLVQAVYDAIGINIFADGDLKDFGFTAE